MQPSGARARDERIRACPNRSGSRPLLSCEAIAEKLNALQRAAETVIKGGANPALLYALFASAANALAAEIAPIVSQPPTESGAEELQLLLRLAIGMQRQTELAPNLFAPAALGGWHISSRSPMGMGSG